MITFPSLYEDELFYSGMARYHWRSINENPKASMIEMFGSPYVCATPFFPSHLRAFCSRLRGVVSYTVEDIINNHSLLPLYAPFVPNERVEKVTDMMLNEDGPSIYMGLGLTASSIKRDSFLKYCPECVTEDEGKHGEAYWHRSHQIERIGVCHKHRKKLVLSNVEINPRHKHNMRTLNQKEMRQLEDDDAISLEIEHFVAQQVYDLLNLKLKPIGLEQIRQYYVSKLQQFDLAHKSGRIKWLELIDQFNAYYSKGYLENVNSYIHPEDEFSWLHKLLRSPRVSCHPLRHILVLGFLNESVNSLMFIGRQQQKKLNSNSKNKNTVSVIEAVNHRINWVDRDIDFSKKVREAAEQITNIEPRLIRVTQTEIGRRLGIQTLLTKSIHKLPRTQSALREVIESTEQFQIRRIKKAVGRLSKQNGCVKSWQVKKAAGLKGKFEQKYEELIAQEIQLQSEIYSKQL